MATRPKLAVLDYGMGNLRSVCKAWEHVGADVSLVNDPASLGSPDALIFPGQGAIVDCMRLLKETGFDAVIRDWVAADKPFFGICLGLQALFEHSEEGDTPGLGIFPGRVVRFRLPVGFKVPHMGWNSVTWTRDTPVDSGLRSGLEQFYFVHSYYVETPAVELPWGKTEYGGKTFTSAIARGRCFATQFHPEKSQTKGLQIYRNFLASL
ncbi:MAG: imidazole glycerol phosphate synthase subunit HisH [Verrucomicrobiota bacterium]|nr:imidazole glycerol phosphate synthase subunit HisH [Verrucomicrobiota bacterium]